MMIWWKWLCDWLKVAVFTFKLFSFWREICWVSCNIPSNSFELHIVSVIWVRCDQRTICNNFSRESCVPFLSACIHDLAPWNEQQMLHSYYSRACTLKQKMGKFQCRVIERSNKMSVMVKCRKLFRLSSQRLIRRNPHLAFYFNWNPIFVISTNLLMVR